MNFYRPYIHSIQLIRECIDAFNADNGQIVRLIKPLNWPNAHCTVEFIYFSRRTNNDNRDLHIIFRYPRTFPNDSVTYLMEATLQFHRDIFASLHHHCGVTSFYVQMWPGQSPRMVTTRGMLHRHNSHVHKLFNGQPGWRMGMNTDTHIYEPVPPANVPIFGLA